MHCREAAQKLQLYLDNRLSIEQARALEAHIANCATCLEELVLLEEVTQNLHAIKIIAEPDDLNEQIMLRVAITAQRTNSPRFSLLRPSLAELLVAVVLATIATLGSILQQPSLRALLPIANGHDFLSLAVMNLLHMLTTIGSNTLILALWVIGTVLGIFITLVVAGNEMRSLWLKAVMERLPVR